MGLSTNVLWHQTSFEGLKAIMATKSFACSYSLETIKWKGSQIMSAFPMISFCDIPFADMSEYLTNKDGNITGKYGKYTIGMKRSWGQRCGLSPVWYRDKDSSSLRFQKDIFDTLKEKRFEEYSTEDKFLWHVLANTKNHEGELKKYGFNTYRFYNEREFRYVPEYELVLGKGYKPSISAAEYDTYKDAHEGHSLINDIHISFDYDDIVYILVSNANKLNAVKELFNGIVNCNVVFMSYDQILHNIIGIGHDRGI